jgi:hypothetical protein
MLIMVLMGLGLGGNMQPMITAVQNAVSPREIGVATSSVTFFRSMGGTLGTAVFLSVLFNVLPGKISSAFQTAQATPEFQQALAADPGQAQTLRQATSGDALSDTSFLNQLSDVVAHPFKVGFSDGIQVVFLMALGVMLIGLIVVLFLPEIPLSMRSAQQQRADDALAAENSNGVPGEVGAGPNAAYDGAAHDGAAQPAGARNGGRPAYAAGGAHESAGGAHEADGTADSDPVSAGRHAAGGDPGR